MVWQLLLQWENPIIYSDRNYRVVLPTFCLLIQTNESPALLLSMDGIVDKEMYKPENAINTVQRVDREFSRYFLLMKLDSRILSC